MGEFKATKLYQDNAGLSTFQLDTLFNSIADWVNAREIDEFNIADNTLTGASFRSDVVDGTSLVLADGSISVAGGSLTSSTFTGEVTADKITSGSLSLTKFGTTEAAIGYGLSQEYNQEDIPAGSEIAEVTMTIRRAGPVLLELVPGSASAIRNGTVCIPAHTSSSSVSNLIFTKNSADLVNYAVKVHGKSAATTTEERPVSEFRAIYNESTPGTYTYGIKAGGVSTLKLSGLLMVKEL